MEQFTTLQMLIVSLIVFFAFAGYLTWGRVRIDYRQQENFERIAEFEYSLYKNPSEYTCYQNSKDDVWEQVNYSETIDRVIQSTKWNYRRILPRAELGQTFSMAADEETQSIYIALGTDSYNWYHLKLSGGQKAHNEQLH